MSKTWKIIIGVLIIIIISVGAFTIISKVQEKNYTRVRKNLLAIQGKAINERANIEIKENVVQATGYKDESKINELIQKEVITEKYNTVLMYVLGNQNLQQMGLGNLETKEKETYIVDYGQLAVDVFYLPGIKYKGKTYYKLSDFIDINKSMMRKMLGL
jgi:hypothetical protein